VIRSVGSRGKFPDVIFRFSFFIVQKVLWVDEFRIGSGSDRVRSKPMTVDEISSFRIDDNHTARSLPLPVLSSSIHNSLKEDVFVE